MSFFFVLNARINFGVRIAFPIFYGILWYVRLPPQGLEVKVLCRVNFTLQMKNEPQLIKSGNYCCKM